MFLSSKAVRSLLQASLVCLSPSGHRTRSIRRRRHVCATEQLEVRQLLTGDLDWVNGFGGADSETAEAVTTDSSGRVYTLGTFVGTVDFDPGPGVFNLTSSGTAERNTFLTRTSATGSLVWAKSMEAQYADDLAVDSVGNVYAVGGYTGADRDLDPGAGVFNVTGPGSLVSHGYILKLNSAGTLISASTIGGFYSRVQAIAIGNTDSIGIAGQFRGTVDFDPGEGSTLRTTPSGNIDGFVSRLNSNGTLDWVSVFAGAGNMDCDDIVSTGNGFVVAGSMAGTNDFNPGTSVFNLTSAGEGDAFAVSLSSSGNFQWAKGFGGTSDDSANGLATDKSGAIWIAGNFRSTVDFDPGTSVFNLTSAGESDAFVAKLTSAGSFVWARRFGGVLEDSAAGVDLDVDGNVYTIGSFRGIVDFDPGAETNNLTSAGDSDVFVGRLDNAGNLVLEIVDEGPGVAQADLPRIFEKFYRAPSSVQTPGTGLGLSIAKGLVEAIDGQIEAAARADGRPGLRITLTLPAAPCP